MTQNTASTATAKTDPKAADAGAQGEKPKDAQGNKVDSDAIPVAKLWFPKRVDFKGKKCADSLAATTTRDKVFDKDGKRSPRQAWTIEYLPRFRHHRVTFYPQGPAQDPVVTFVHEAQVSNWEPMT